MNERLQVYDTKMQKSLDNLDGELRAMRAGRANPHILDKLVVDYYGMPTPIQQVANISVPEARMIQIQPWEKSMIKEIEKALIKAELGVAPNNDGVCIRLNFPPLTEERRRETAKDVKKYGEDAKVAIRNIRRDFIDKYKKMEKNHEITEDDLKNTENDIQKLTDSYIKDIDNILVEKEKEILSV